ncbi:MAG TPA: DUF1003 domain-containing protein [Pseudolabrys sp.]|nr:DUF1003 domain-containing protein [Pseudolabrys sp.]
MKITASFFARVADLTFLGTLAGPSLFDQSLSDRRRNVKSESHPSDTRRAQCVVSAPSRRVSMSIVNEGTEASTGPEVHVPAEKKSAKGICAVSGKERPRRDLISLDDVRPSLAERIRLEHPEMPAEALISRSELARYRTMYVEELLKEEHGELTELDRQVAESIANHDTIAENVDEEYEDERTLGERWSDHLASFGGSWTFIILFAAVMAIWIVFNAIALESDRFDPYPYILLNLILSTLAAVQAPIIMMSQNRQEAKDRLRSESDYRVNLKAELEIRHLHEKMDHLISRQWQRLAEIQQMQLELMHDMSRSGARR